MIELRDAGKVYPVGDHEVVALHSVTETIARGEHVAIMGPSGSGKSTLLNVIGCLARPTSGTVRLDGEDIQDLDATGLADVRARKVGFVFQAYHLVPRLTAQANVELPLMLAGVPRGERHRRALAALEQVGLAHRAGHRPGQLSGGEQQRVAIARSVVRDPPILLADEPTGNLDRKAGGQILDLLDRWHEQGLTLVVVTHDPLVADRAQRVLILVDGAISRRVEGHEFPHLWQNPDLWGGPE